MLVKKFEEEYKKLNKKQKEAVDSIEGPVMVIAGPGTGKTTILTLRTANILKETDTPPSGILCLTFTEAGARAMREKLLGIIGERAREIAIDTFHGFAIGAIREFGDHFPAISKAENISEIEAENMIREILKDKKFSTIRPLGDPEYYVSKILSAISESKKEAWTPEMVESFAKEEIERIKNDETSISTRGASKGNLKAEALARIEKCEKTMLFAQVYNLYEKRKREEKKIDFNDMIFELLSALRSDTLLLRSLQEKYLYIMVDEHQDSNDTQNLIIKVIADFFESPNLFIVGDEKQAIYRFQGASVENFLKFQNIWNGMKLISLEDNYRSHQKILDAAFKMIEKNYEEDEHQNLRVRLKANKKNGGPIEVLVCIDAETEETEMARRLKKIEKEEPEKTVAVITRRNADAERIFRVLEDTGIKAKAEIGADIFKHPIGLLYFSLIEFLFDPKDTEAFGETLAGGLWKLSFQKQVELISLLRRGGSEEVFDLIKEIGRLEKEVAQTGPIEFLILAADVSGFSELASETVLGNEIWRSIVKLAEEILKAQKIESPKQLIEALLLYKKTSDRRPVKISAGESSAQIKVMTTHSSKGLEFDYVFMPYATEEAWIKKDRGNSFVLPKEKRNDDYLRDERRLFYVGITRAKEHVVISLHKENSSGKTTLPVRFIEELGEKDVSILEIEKVERDRSKKNLELVSQKRLEEKIEFAKNSLLENGLSVTALNHFLECPNKFFYKSVLKLPEAPSPTSEKGNAMHEAMKNVWAAKKSGELNKEKIEKIITDSAKNYFNRSLLYKFEREAALEELLKDAPTVASELLPHFGQEGEISTESWHDKNIEIDLNKEKIILRMHGKLDAILDTGKEALIYDYKTKKVMSINAIKGETENENGDYFRQLVFYKILLSSEPRFDDKKITPSLVFIRPDPKGRCPTITVPIEKIDIEEVESQIKNLIESVWSGSILSQTCSDPDCKYCKFNKL